MFKGPSAAATKKAARQINRSAARPRVSCCLPLVSFRERLPGEFRGTRQALRFSARGTRAAENGFSRTFFRGESATFVASVRGIEATWTASLV
jgi:hypothetical protein